MIRPARYSRYPGHLSILMASLAVLGFVLAATNARALFVPYCIVYLLVVVAWWCLARSLEPKK